ncbi:MAG: phasin family protein [Caldilineaceae bacterium]|nr:phasin family protein [Caldilineaceae bacterium]HRJ43311.1 phasin family protein [Caldilineaceae bacterium]
MEVKLDVRNIDLRNAQEAVEDNLKLAQKTSRKVALTYAGLLGLAYDEAKAILERGCKMVSDAEHRGEKMEAATLRQVKNARKGVEKQVKKAEKEVEKAQKRFTKQLRRSEAKAENEMESQVEKVLERLGIPSRERIIKLSAEIEALSRKIDQEVVQAGETEWVAPLAEYDTMTAREIVALMEGMSAEQMAEVKAYEMAHDNRVTVIREVERRQEAVVEESEIVVA